jgi:RNA polymerase sigma-70 factor (ECF subfamily)
MHPRPRAARKPGMNALAPASAHRDPATFVLALRQPGRRMRMDPPPRLRSDPTDAEEAQLAALLRAAAVGDARAFEQFYEATARRALGLVRRIAGDALAEDILADCYLQAWQQAGRFDAARGTPLAWLMTLARSRALDRLRQEALRHGGLRGAPEHEADAEAADHLPGPDALLESVQASTRLHAALAALSPNERWVLGLAYFRDFTQGEIAALTGMPLGTVKSHLNRAQHKLRAALE